MSRENVELVRAAVEAFGRGEVERALDMTHPQLVTTRVDPDNAVRHGREGFLAMVADWTEGFEGWGFSGDDFADAGDAVVVRTRQWARGAGSGVPVEAEFWIVYEVADDLITRVSIYSDKAEALATAGVPRG
jgi:ketosteroid isomerase-like protein